MRKRIFLIVAFILIILTSSIGLILSIRIVYYIDYTNGDIEVLLKWGGLEIRDLPIPKTLFSSVAIGENNKNQRSDWHVAASFPVILQKVPTFEGGNTLSGIIIISEKMMYLSDTDKALLKNEFLNILRKDGSFAAKEFAYYLDVDSINKKRKNLYPNK